MTCPKIKLLHRPTSNLAQLRGSAGDGRRSRAHRFGLRVAVSFREQGHSGWLDARTVNVSRTGLLMDCRYGANVGAPLELLLKFGPPLANVSCAARVVRVEPMAGQGHWMVAATIFRYAFLRKPMAYTERGL